MTENGLAVRDTAAIVDRLVTVGDVGKMTAEERVKYYAQTCESLGLNPLTRPFEFLSLQGKTVMYVRKDATDQLRKVHKVAITIAGRSTENDVHVVIARASTPDGRTDESVGAVPIGGLKGEQLANALMKAETKAKRRVTLSICGLGMLDETELDTIPGAKPIVEAVPEQAAAALLTVEEFNGMLSDYIARIGGAKDIKALTAIYAEMTHDARLPGWVRAKVQEECTAQRKKLEGKAA